MDYVPVLSAGTLAREFANACAEPLGPYPDFVRAGLAAAMLKERGRKRLRKKKAMFALTALWLRRKRMLAIVQRYGGSGFAGLSNAVLPVVLPGVA